MNKNSFFNQSIYALSIYIFPNFLKACYELTFIFGTDRKDCEISFFATNLYFSLNIIQIYLERILAKKVDKFTKTIIIINAQIE